MKIIILHHHLKRGGVTRIIELQIKSLLSSQYIKDDIKILCGHAPTGEEISKVETIVEPELDYLYRENLNTIELKNHLKLLESILKKHIEPEDILHVHNYGLGKNPIFTIAISKMINEGYKILNHCHDFAEDRPANMNYLEEVITNQFHLSVSDVLYPIKKNLYYGVINKSDKERLYESGIPEEYIQYLPNPVDSEDFDSVSNNKTDHKISIRTSLSIPENKKLVTYPVRIIRRKNIEELILLSIIHKDRIVFAVTLAPENPVEIEYYKFWKNFAQEQNLPILFDVGNSIDFRKLIAGSDFCITTSIMEGFGMTFLEPWLTNTPVVGRDLPYVTTDFKKSGLVFSKLYKNIILRNYNNKDFKDLKRDEHVIFLTKLINSSEEKKSLLLNNPELETLFSDIDSLQIEKNKHLIKNIFSILNYGKLINDVYKKLSE